MSTIITAKQNSDLDGVSSAIVYASYLNALHKNSQFVAAFSGEMQFEVKYMLELLGITELFRDIESIPDQELTSFILVDYSERSGINKRISPDKVEEVIDHRNFPTFDEFKNARFRIEFVGACVTLIAEKFLFHKEIPLSTSYAQLLYCGLFSNTLNFASQMTGYRDTRIRERLEKFGIDKEMPIRMFHEKTEYVRNNTMKVLYDDAKLVILENGQLVNYLQLEVRDSKRFLENQAFLATCMSNLHPNEDVLCILHLHLHDISQGKTFLFSNYEYFLWFMQAHHFPGKINGKTCYELPKLFLRKDTIPLFKELLLEIDKSSIMQQFLK